MDTVNLFSQFKWRKSGRVVGPSEGQIFTAAPHVLYRVECFDERHRKLSEQVCRNAVTREGIGYLLGTAFQASNGGHTIKTNFYVTQYKNNFSIVTTVTASAPGYTEITYGSGDVSQANRPVLTLGALSTGADAISCDNSASKAVFNHLTTITVYGLSLVSVNVAGTSNVYIGDILYGLTAYTTSLAVQTGYEVDVQATIQATAG
jgi:hypothetical protein